jgi:hypothetical protein
MKKKIHISIEKQASVHRILTPIVHPARRQIAQSATFGKAMAGKFAAFHAAKAERVGERR